MREQVDNAPYASPYNRLPDEGLELQVGPPVRSTKSEVCIMDSLLLAYRVGTQIRTLVGQVITARFGNGFDSWKSKLNLYCVQGRQGPIIRILDFFDFLIPAAGHELIIGKRPYLVLKRQTSVLYAVTPTSRLLKMCQERLGNFLSVALKRHVYGRCLVLASSR